MVVHAKLPLDEVCDLGAAPRADPRSPWLAGVYEDHPAQPGEIAWRQPPWTARGGFCGNGRFAARARRGLPAAHAASVDMHTPRHIGR